MMMTEMKFFITVYVLISVAVCDAELNLEAADGENVTIPFKSPDLERADQVKITFTRESQTNVTARYCRCAHCGDCDVVETPGVLLQVKEGTFTLLRVSSRNSGLYEVIIIGKRVSRIKTTLVVNKPPFSSIREPTQSSVSKPPNSSERQRLYGLIAPVVFISVVLGVCFFCKCWKEREPLADVEDA